MKHRVAIILGTRPEAIKLIPIYLELKKSDIFKPILISTGQHEEMLKQIFLFFEIKPDIELHIMSKNQTLSSLTSLLFTKLESIFKVHSFDITFVQGDTTTAFVGAMTSFYHHIKVAHIEAGLRTYDKNSPFPEEINRQMIGNIADIHFSPTQKASENLMKENIKNIVEVGNTVIDSLFLAREKINKNILGYKRKFKPFIDEKKKIILVTCHRRESFGEALLEICDALISIIHNHTDILIIYPVHLNPNVQEIVYKKLQKYHRIHLLDPLPYDDLIYIMSQSWLIMTDSGGIQEEAPSLNIPLLVMRDKTEREEGIENGCAILCGIKSASIIEIFKHLINSPQKYQKMVNAINPYGDGTTSQQIVHFLEGYKL